MLSTTTYGSAALPGLAWLRPHNTLTLHDCAAAKIIIVNQSRQIQYCTRIL